MLAHFQKKKTGFCLGADIWGREQEGAEGVVERNRSEKTLGFLACICMLMTPCFITWRAGVAIDMLIRFHVCCAYVTKSNKTVLWLQSCMAAERINSHK